MSKQLAILASEMRECVIKSAYDLVNMYVNSMLDSGENPCKPRNPREEPDKISAHSTGKRSSRLNHSSCALYTKYFRLVGIPDKVAYAVNLWISKLPSSNLWRSYVVREEVLRDKYYNVVIRYKLRGRELTEKLWKPMKHLGREGLKALILRIILDLLEDTIRPKKRNSISQYVKWLTGQRHWYCIQFCDFQHCIDDLLREIINLMRQHLEELRKDLEICQAGENKSYLADVIYEIYTAKC